MLRTNLSTRPFYNQRAIRAGLAVIGAAALAFTVYNAVQIVSLTREQRRLSNEATAAEARARELRRTGQQLRAELDRGEVEAVRLAATEANALIARRAFSWTSLFGHFEQTLPADVRIISVAPQADSEGRLMLAIAVNSRRVEDLDEFIRALEATGAFRAVLARQEEVMPDGLLRSIIQGYYGATAASPVLTSEPSEAATPQESGPPATGGPS